MSLGGSIRRLLFFRGNIYDQYREVRNINSERSEKNESLIKNRLNFLLQHAIDTTAFYSGLQNDISRFPVINKQTIIDNRESMTSSNYKGKKLFEMHTSGSTGIPFVIQQNSEKRHRCIAEIKAMNDLSNYPSHEKMLFLVGATRKIGYSKKQQFKENIYRIGVSKNDDENMKRVVDFIIKKRPWAVHASISSLPPVMDYIKKKQIPFNKVSLKSIITGGEMVPDKLCDDLRSVFGKNCLIAIKYSNEEMGIFGISTGRSDEYILNVADYYFEILKMNSDEPCENGELGRIVITDLYNMAVPMIRYDTGDIGALKIEDGKWPKLVNLSGKIRDLIYDTEGISISGATMTNTFKNVKNVKMYQIIQEEKKRYRYKIVPENLNNVPSNDDILLNDLMCLLGEDAEVIVDFVDEIPTIKSGKRRYTVNLYRTDG